jgi:hypothetical protein
MRALILTLIAAAGLVAAGCGASSGGVSEDDQALISALNGSKQRLTVLAERIKANPLDDDKDFDAYVRDMRATAREFDALSGNLSRVPKLEKVRAEMNQYVAELGTAAGLARDLATAVEDQDVKRIGKAESAYINAASGLVKLQTTIDRKLNSAS